MDRSTLIVFAILLVIDTRRIQCRPNNNHHLIPIRACGAALTNILIETCPFGFNPYYRSDENQNIEQGLYSWFVP